jgi:hypothetical protein
VTLLKKGFDDHFWASMLSHSRLHLAGLHL